MMLNCTGSAFLQRWKKLVMSVGLLAAMYLKRLPFECKGFLPQVLITEINFPCTAHTLQNFTCLFCFFPNGFL